MVLTITEYRVGIEIYRVPSGFKNEMVLSTTYGDGKGGATMCGKPATFS